MAEGIKKCPMCASLILIEALVCKECKYLLSTKSNGEIEISKYDLNII